MGYLGEKIQADYLSNTIIGGKMRNYSSGLTNRPQNQPIFGRTDMEKNNAGGFSFKITPQQQLERFLLIGSEGGTYYVNEQKLTEDNAENIVKLIKKDGVSVVQTVANFASEGRAPKADAGLFVLALCATYGNEDTKKAAYKAISTVCRTSTQLFLFLSNIQNLRGWSKGLCKGVAKFYTSRTNDQIAYQLTKYRERAGFTHADALRLSHARPTNKDQADLFGYAVGKVKPEETSSQQIRCFEMAKTASGKDLINLIKEGHLTWEMVPTESLNDKTVLSHLLDHMPLNALMRNLNRFAYNGLTDGNSEVTKRIVAKLTNEEYVKKAGMHPLNVINSLATYASGRGQLGSKTWTVNQNIVDATTETYELAVKHASSSGKNILIGVDISGSMNSAVDKMALTCAQIANVLALTLLKTEKNAELIWFDTALHNPTMGRRTSVDTAIKNTPHGGGTDCSLPLVHAANTLNKYDAIIILTDNETWAGQQHSYDVLQSYRKNVNKNVKVIEVAMVSTPYTNIPDDDPNLLRVVGFDASVISLINEYLK